MNNTLKNIMDSFGPLNQDELEMISGFGKVAGEHGSPKKDNPYREGTEAYKKWNEGWEEGKKKSGGNHGK